MANEHENADSINGDKDVEEVVVEDTDDVAALKEKLQKTSEANKQLFARAKKAEGFELKDGKWVKPPKDAIKASPEEDEVATPYKESDKTDDLGYGEKAFLRSYDIKGSDELALVKDWTKRTGDSLDAVVEDEIFLAKLGKLREARAATDAIPKGKSRGAQPPSDDVEYWKQKIDSGSATLADVPDVELRRKVLNSRIETEKVGNRFTNQPVVHG